MGRSFREAITVPLWKKTMVIAGFGALVALAAGRALAPDDARAVQACLPDAEEPDPAAASAGGSVDPAQRALAEHLSRRFLIAAEATEQMVAAAFRAARHVGLDPLLVLAVISVESRFNPIAESVMGAKGLMQIIPRYHQEKLRAHGGDYAVLDPESNILVCSQILQEYVRRTGTLEAGLQFYNGAFSDASAHYAQKVMAERQRLELVIRATGRNS